MCGLTGFWQPDGFAASSRGGEIVEAMALRLFHRGPDDSGMWVDEKVGIALAHRRLSILDLSPAGHQPMVSVSGRFVMVFNGEIYNHLELRKEVCGESDEGYDWRGHSDTETLLAATERWGIEATLKKSVGMFSIAVWDREARLLTLARDRLGEKPLYYGWQGNTFLFGSELKALRVHPAFEGRIDRQALALLLRYNYIPAPYSIYRGICKLLPGTFLIVRQNGEGEGPREYWSARAVAEIGRRNLFSGDEQEAGQELDEVLGRAVAGQMVADVPLGAFLSGGIDSSMVVALMQSRSARPVKTFTIGFYGEGYNEAEHAKRVARHLGTEHTELYVTAEDALALVPRIPSMYDEPFADSSQVPTFLVAQLARQHVTVALSGDGGDELFGGYNRYLLVGNIWRSVGLLPPFMRSVIADILTALPPHLWDSLFCRLFKLLPITCQFSNPGDKLHKLAEIMPARSPEELYRNLASFWKHPEEIVRGGCDSSFVLHDLTAQPGLSDFAHRMMHLDLVSYLPDDILVKVDRAAMAVSLETRVPFLDQRLVEFAWRLPFSMKIRHGQGKWLLRQVLHKYVPKELVERPKMGFGIPLDAWLRGPLREWAEALLAEDRLRREGFLNPELVREKWLAHLAGGRNWAYHLWGVLMFQSWLEETI